MDDVLTDNLGRLGYRRARRVLLAAGLLVVGVVMLAVDARGADGIDVLAAALFAPVLVALAYGGIGAGVAAAAVAAAAHLILRLPEIGSEGWGTYAGLVVPAAVSYLGLGLIGGWAWEALRRTLEGAALYDEAIDLDTGLSSATELLRILDLEAARAARYRTLFSVAVIEVPASALAPLGGRRRRTLLRELGRALGSGIREVDRIGHARDAHRHRFVAILPETASEGAEVFRHRFAELVRGFLAARGVSVTPAETVSRALTHPGDDDLLAKLRRELDDAASPSRGGALAG